MADSANVNQSKKWVADISLEVCIRLSFRFALPAQSETKIEPDLRLLCGIIILHENARGTHVISAARKISVSFGSE